MSALVVVMVWSGGVQVLHQGIAAALAGGSLRSLLEEFGPLSETTVISYIRQILTGLHYLHRKMIVHGDLKCAFSVIMMITVAACVRFVQGRAFRRQCASVDRW